VVGGGILGGALALRLSEYGHHVTLYERAPALGGLASSFQIGDVAWDRFYHVTLLSDSALRSFLDELGLEEEMRWVATETALYDGGKLYPVSSAVDYLRLPVLSAVAKARIGATVLRASRVKDWRPLENVAAADWLVRWSGRPAYEAFWRPLLRAKLGDRHAEASAAFIWAIIHRLYAARRAGMKRDLFGYVPGGYARVLDQLHLELENRGVDVRTSSVVRSVTESSGRVSVETNGVAEIHDAAVVTTPSPIAVGLMPHMEPEEREAHASIMYQGIVCVSLLLDRPLGGYYVTNITDSGIPFTGVIEMSALVDPTEFGGRSLVYLPKYVAPNDGLFDASDGEITRTFVEAVAHMYPAFEESHIVAAEVSRARHVLPVSTIAYSSRLPPARSSVAGVHVVNTAHIVNGTLNINETLQLVDRVLPDLMTAPVPERST
jgi:protoporphyrinogen oxidase